MTDHLNDFQSIVNQLVTMKNGYAWWDASIFVVVFITRQLGNFVVTISDFILNLALSMELVKGNLFNEKTRRKTYDTKNTQTIIIKSKGKKVMTSLREGRDLDIKSNIFIVEKMVIWK